jgi:hypothetical protein
MSNNKPQDEKPGPVPKGPRLVEMPKRPVRKIDAEWIEEPATLREIPRR